MISRRSFLSACCALHFSSWAQAQTQQKGFVCSTVDRGADIDQKMELDRYSVDAAFDRKLLDDIVNEFKLTPYGTANLGHRWRRSDGLTPNTGKITLGVHFLNGDASQWQRAEQAARTWLQGELGSKIDFRFGVDRSAPQITIMFGSGRNNSIVGRASAEHAKTHTTMNLTDLDGYVVAHEFGHALGLQHEHQNPSTAIKWNKPVIVSEMAAQGWSPQDCESNIFSKFSQQYACVGSPTFDSRSIMLYPIPSHWTLDGYSTGTNASISANDRACVTGIYRA